jgi:hypothetical protein
VEGVGLILVIFMIAHCLLEMEAEVWVTETARMQIVMQELQTLVVEEEGSELQHLRVQMEGVGFFLSDICQMYHMHHV